MPSKTELLEELQTEYGLSRKMLERVNLDNPQWKPHEKSMTIQRLSSHIAELPQWMERITAYDHFDFLEGRLERSLAKNNEELLALFETSYNEATNALKSIDDGKLSMDFKIRRGEIVLINQPRYKMIRSWIFSHTIHHRGQLSVYLRLLNIPVPGIYGPSADEA